MDLMELAQQAVALHPDQAEARKAVLRRISRDTKLRDAILEEIVSEAVRSAVYLMRADLRRDQKGLIPARDDVTRAGAMIGLSLLDSWQIGDRLLGDADADYLRRHAQHERARAAGHVQNATFYESLASRVPAGKVVRQVVDAAAVQALLDATRDKHEGGGSRKAAGLSIARAAKTAEPKRNGNG